MKRIIFAVLVHIFFQSTNAIIGIPAQSTTSQANVYKSGELLEYSIYYGFYNIAHASLSVTDSILNGIKTHHLEAFAETKGMSSYLFKVRDSYQSFVDVETNLPVLSIRNIREGRYKHYNEVRYNRQASEAVSLKTGVHTVPTGIQDVLSVFYLARKIDFNEELREKQILTYQSFFCDTIYDVFIQYQGIDVVTLNKKDVSCYKFYLCEKNKGIITPDEEMCFWISRDGNRIPIKILFGISVGSFVVELDRFSGLLNPFPVSN